MAFKKPYETLQEIQSSGCVRVTLGLDVRLIQGFMAGAFIALGSLIAIVVGGGVPGIKEANPGLQKFIFGSLFPVGLILVVITSAELFTGNVGCIVPGVLSKKIHWLDGLKNWFWVYIGNFIGSISFAYFLVYLTGILGKEPWLSSVIAISENKISQDFTTLFFKGVGCNWLVCLSIWLAIASDDVVSKMFGIWFPIMTFVTVGFEHSVANMFFVPMGIMLGANVTWGQFFIVNLIPVTLGNIVGGSLFVGTVYWYLYGRNK
ncbi:MAG: formate/nitrite transporter family protein [Elusimicrobia bacterium]|nr:formate/nitrite transporter family protein [Elusimicrobiota bacterium]